MRVFLAAIAILLLGAGCVHAPGSSPSAEQTAPQPSQRHEPAERPAVQWESASSGIDRLDTRVRETRVIVYRLDLDEVALSMRHGEPRFVSTWQRGAGALLVANGVYFHEDGLPSGLLRIDGERVGERAFDEDRTGLIQFDPFRIIDTADEPRPEPAPIEAQSYPFLLKSGEPAVAADSGLAARRTFIASDAHGNAYLGLIPEHAVTLYELARVLPELPVEWEYALNLDGGPSSGIAGPKKTFDSLTSVPNVIAAFRLEP